VLDELEFFELGLQELDESLAILLDMRPSEHFRHVKLA
jgi:hypothetical protein